MYFFVYLFFVYTHFKVEARCYGQIYLSVVRCYGERGGCSGLTPTSQTGYYTYSRGRKEENVLFNDALNTYGVRHMVKDHSDNEKGSFRLAARVPLYASSHRQDIHTYHSLF